MTDQANENEDESRLSRLTEECEVLRARIRGLEGEIDRYRAQEQLLTKTLMVATGLAEKIRREARQEAEHTLRKARAEAERRTADAMKERDHLQGELARLRHIVDTTRKGLAKLLAGMLGEVRLRELGELAADPSSSSGDLEGALSTALGRSVRAEGDVVPEGDIALTTPAP